MKKDKNSQEVSEIQEKVHLGIDPQYMPTIIELILKELEIQKRGEFDNILLKGLSKHQEEKIETIPLKTLEEKVKLLNYNNGAFHAHIEK